MGILAWFKENVSGPVSKANEYLSDRFKKRKFKELIVSEGDNNPLRLAKQTGTVLYDGVQLSRDIVTLPLYAFCKGGMYLSGSTPKSGLLKSIQEESLAHQAGNVVVDAFATVFDTSKLVLYTLEGLAKGAGYVGRGIGHVTHELFDKETVAYKPLEPTASSSEKIVNKSSSSKPAQLVKPKGIVTNGLIKKKQSVYKTNTLTPSQIKQKQAFYTKWQQRAAHLPPQEIINKSDLLIQQLKQFGTVKNSSDPVLKVVGKEWNSFVTGLPEQQKKAQVDELISSIVTFKNGRLSGVSTRCSAQARESNLLGDNNLTRVAGAG